MLAAKGIAVTISPEELAQLSIQRFEGRIQLVTSPADLDQFAADIRHETVIGFDTETPPTFRKGQSYLPTLVQIATARAAYLFQLRHLPDTKLLRTTLENPRLIKAGLALAYDLKELRRVVEFQEQNTIDLGQVAHRIGLKKTGLRNLAGIFLGYRVAKGPRTSNWGRHPLTPQQINYAATDAWICRELYLRFQKLGLLDA
jgi:ribonuclease D